MMSRVANVTARNQSRGVASSGSLADGVSQFRQHRGLELRRGIGAHLGRLRRGFVRGDKLVHEASTRCLKSLARPSSLPTRSNVKHAAPSRTISHGTSSARGPAVCVTDSGSFPGRTRRRLRRANLRLKGVELSGRRVDLALQGLELLLRGRQSASERPRAPCGRRRPRPASGSARPRGPDPGSAAPPRGRFRP